MSPLAHGADAAGAIAASQVVLLIVLVAAALAYALGLRRLGGTSATPLRKGLRRQGRARTLAFFGGELALAAALLPPLDTLADARFSAHMAQHMVLILVAAPLVAAGSPGLPLTLALTVRRRREVARWRHRLSSATLLDPLRSPVTAWLLHIVALWAWHMPAAFDAALGSEPVHVVEHASFFLTAWLFWWHVAARSRRVLSGGAAVLYVLVTAAPGAALGAILTFAQTPLYEGEALAAAGSGVAPLADQQLAGLVMWVPGGVIYLAVSVTLFLSWFAALGTGTSTGGVRPSGPAPVRERVLVAPEEARR